MEHQVKAYAFIAPSLLILTVFVFIPLAGAIGISLMNIDIYMKISRSPESPTTSKCFRMSVWQMLRFIHFISHCLRCPSR